MKTPYLHRIEQTIKEIQEESISVIDNDKIVIAKAILELKALILNNLIHQQIKE